MVGLRAAEPGLALLGLLRHRPRRLAGPSPLFLGRCPTTQHQRAETEGDDGQGDRRHIGLPTSDREWLRRGRAFQPGADHGQIDDYDRDVTWRHVGALTRGRAFGSERHADGSHGQHHRRTAVDIGDDLERIDRVGTLGHVEDRDHTMSGQGLIAVVQIRRRRDLEIASHESTGCPRRIRFRIRARTRHGRRVERTFDAVRSTRITGGDRLERWWCDGNDGCEKRKKNHVHDVGTGSVLGERDSLDHFMERFGLVGLPNAGKSSLYNALTGGGALAAPYAFATKDPNIGVAKVPDDRLDRLAVMSASKNVVHASVQVVDIGGLVEGASKGEGLGNKFLANIREVDAIVLVLRAFVDDDVPGPSDPLEHLRVVEIELALADLETVEKRLAQAQRQSKLDRNLLPEVEALEKAQSALSEGRPLYRAGLTTDQREILEPHFLLTNRRVLVVANVGENELDSIPSVEARIAAEFNDAGDNVEIIGMCVQLEAEAATIEDPAERAEMLEGFGLGEGALFRMVRSAYHLLGLRTFFTTGEKESRAWTFRADSSAPECAGRIHTDFQRGFIKAEVVHWDELLELGSWVKAKEAGKIRVEGKEYHPVDGDVMEFRFNV